MSETETDAWPLDSLTYASTQVEVRLQGGCTNSDEAPDLIGLHTRLPITERRLLQKKQTRTSSRSAAQAGRGLAAYWHTEA